MPIGFAGVALYHGNIIRHGEAGGITVIHVALQVLDACEKLWGTFMSCTGFPGLGWIGD